MILEPVHSSDGVVMSFSATADDTDNSDESYIDVIASDNSQESI